MSELSKQYHSIQIGDINTWDDWHLVPESRPVINPPEVKTNYIEIPGANGSLDYTEALTGAPVYGDRKGSWSFIVMNGYQEWYNLYYAIMNYLHGKKFTIYLEDDPSFTYDGRLSLNQWTSDKEYSKIQIDYVLSPSKTAVSGRVDDWKWDELTFDTDSYIIYYGSFRVNGETHKKLYNDTPNDIKLFIHTTAEMDVDYWYGTVHLVPGDNETDIYIWGTEEHEKGKIYDNLLTFKGYGTVTLNYHSGGGL